MIEISNFIKSFQKPYKLLKSFSKYTSLFSKKVCSLSSFVFGKDRRVLHIHALRHRQMVWTLRQRHGRLTCRGFTVHSSAVIPLSINFNSTNKKLNKSGIMSSVVFYERSVVKKAEPDIL
jgi:hypothetical protein